jgi:hypothetical protein
MWRRAYETEILDGYRLVIGRGPTPEASQAAARVMVERISPATSGECATGEGEPGDGSASSKALGPQMQLELRPMSHMSGFGHFKVFNGAEIR